MAKENYQACLDIILHHEGGYVNHPKDPGGETNLGVTKRVYEDFGGTKDMKDLTVEDVAPIYEKNYWGRMKCDDIPAGLDLCVFGFGPNTLRKLGEYIDEHGIENAIKNFQAARQSYYESLSTFETFGRGWTRRVDETTELALSMV